MGNLNTRVNQPIGPDSQNYDGDQGMNTGCWLPILSSLAGFVVGGVHAFAQGMPYTQEVHNQVAIEAVGGAVLGALAGVLIGRLIERVRK